VIAANWPGNVVIPGLSGSSVLIASDVQSSPGVSRGDMKVSRVRRGFHARLVDDSMRVVIGVALATTTGVGAKSTASYDSAQAELARERKRRLKAERIAEQAETALKKANAEKKCGCG